MLTFEVVRQNGPRLLAEEAVTTEDETTGICLRESRSTPTSKFVVSSSSEETSSSGKGDVSSIMEETVNSVGMTVEVGEHSKVEASDLPPKSIKPVQSTEQILDSLAKRAKTVSPPDQTLKSPSEDLDILENLVERTQLRDLNTNLEVDLLKALEDLDGKMTTKHCCEDEVEWAMSLVGHMDNFMIVLESRNVDVRKQVQQVEECCAHLKVTLKEALSKLSHLCEMKEIRSVYLAPMVAKIGALKRSMVRERKKIVLGRMPDFMFEQLHRVCVRDDGGPSNIAREGIKSILEEADFIKVGDDEVAFLAHGDTNDENNVLSLWYDGLKLLVVTDGKKGCRYFTKGIEHLQHALEISPENVAAYFGLASKLLSLSKESVNNGAFSWGASLLKEASDVANASTVLTGKCFLHLEVACWKNKRLIRISAKAESAIHAKSVTAQTSFNSLMPKISKLPLQAASLRLPVNENVRVDIEELEGALNSASNVIETMSSHFQSFLSKKLPFTLVNPARGSGRYFDELLIEINVSCKKIDKEFGYTGYEPIVYIDKTLSISERIAFYSIAECNVVSVVRDGMNLTPYEYIVCRQGVSGLGSGSDSSGIKKSMLVVSEFVGYFPSLGGAIRINQWKIETIGEALNEAISMEESEKRLLRERHYRYVSTHDVAYWSRSFMQDLERTCKDHFRSRCYAMGISFGF
ncbi:hypothetical protein GIB67_042804 [Kingdonia uniflora]|uniref:Carbohydrate kinase PfkB domain-containing protein n=1 Tax=Kingdonia uniflora TaxID=39325 RepID=A0A7J7L157_9MAGN|nr:hypothetical protein GIB67_042804 [Kingdonia uniflora]